ncbi:beta-lactamase [Fusarium longipes]|uniref:Beta-lactamase n=1 Tax=Fusarium longipes TaxID=694270 RepID=A0A395SWV7_9HYPO|nr:beta-lactamase [Fusarium longipes]
MSRTIEDAVQAAIDSGKVNGAVICATNSKGDFSYNAALGQRTLITGEKRPQRLDDILCLASASKLPTSIAALQCVEEGLLTLKGDLSTVAPELADKKVLTGWSDDDEPVLEDATQKITLEMLLTHSAGTAYDFLQPSIGKWSSKYKPKDGAKRTVEDTFIYPLSHQPGAGWMYGPGLDWAGRIVERVTGDTLEKRIQERILKPLGCENDAQFQPITRQDLRDRLVELNPDDPQGIGYAIMGQGAYINTRSEGCFGGHGLAMSATSYIKILQSLLSNDGKLLKPETVNDMFQNHLSPEASTGHQAMLASPMGPFFRVGIDENTKLGHGLGGAVTLEDIDGWYGAHTMSWGGGLTLAWFIDRKNDICAIGAICAALPLGDEVTKVATDLKDVVRKDVYRKYATWKEGRQ